MAAPADVSTWTRLGKKINDEFGGSQLSGDAAGMYTVAVGRRVRWPFGLYAIENITNFDQ